MKANEPIVRITSFHSDYKSAFRYLNEEWISNYFVMEPNDYKVLDHPETEIIQKGGHILVALLDEVPVGVCALVKLTNHQYDYEMAKMAVSPKAQGLKIGYKLAQSIVDLAKELGGTTIYLESNTQLTPAINLYKKLGFKEIENANPHYERVDIQMAMNL